MSYIFISYVEEDSIVAAKIAAGIEASGYTVWYYERNSLPGLSYLLQVSDAIGSASAVLVIISPDSLSSSQVTNEIIGAFESNKPFIPVLVGIKHIEFQTRQPIWRQALGAATSIYFDINDYDNIMSRIVDGIKALSISATKGNENTAHKKVRQETGQAVIEESKYSKRRVEQNDKIFMDSRSYYRNWKLVFQLFSS